MVLSVFDRAMSNSAVDRRWDGQTARGLPDAQQDLGSAGRAGSTMPGSVLCGQLLSSQLAKPLERAGALPGKCLILLKDSFVA